MNTCGGYFITKAVARPAYVSSGLLPPRIVSLSECMCDCVPDIWAIEWTGVSPEDRTAKASKAGIAAATLDQVIRWTTQQMNTGAFGWPRVFFTIDDARVFAERFLSPDGDFKLLGIGLSTGVVEQFLVETAPGSSMGVPGVYTAVSRRTGLESGGTVLGWEVLCYEYGGFHSWLCNGLEVDVAEKYQIRPNETGFITSAAEASAAAEYCGREDVGAEPGFWAPWLVVEYALFPTRTSGEDRALR
jgi:hypothetical protein